MLSSCFSKACKQHGMFALLLSDRSTHRRGVLSRELDTEGGKESNQKDEQASQGVQVEKGSLLVSSLSLFMLNA